MEDKEISITLELSKEKIEKKLRTSSELYNFALRVKMEQLKQKFPEKTETELKKEATLLIQKANQ